MSNDTKELVTLRDGLLESVFSLIPGGSFIYFPWKYRNEISSGIPSLVGSDKKNILNWILMELNNLLNQAIHPTDSNREFLAAFKEISTSYPNFYEKKLPDELLTKAQPSINWAPLGTERAIESIVKCNERISISVSSIQFLDLFCLLNLNQIIDKKIQLKVTAYMGADQADNLSEPLPEILIFPVSTFSKRVATHKLLQNYSLVSTPHKIKSSIVYKRAKLGGTLNIHGLGKGVSLDVIDAAKSSLQRNIEIATWDSEDFKDYIGYVKHLDEGELYSAFDPFLTLFSQREWNIVDECTLSSPMGVFLRNDLSIRQRDAGLAIAKLIHLTVLEMRNKREFEPKVVKRAAKALINDYSFCSKAVELYCKFESSSGSISMLSEN